MLFVGLGDLGVLYPPLGLVVDACAGNGEEKEVMCRFGLVVGGGGVASLQRSSRGNSG